jgi:hypothetical protein
MTTRLQGQSNGPTRTRHMHKTNQRSLGRKPALLTIIREFKLSDELVVNAAYSTEGTGRYLQYKYDVLPFDVLRIDVTCTMYKYLSYDFVLVSPCGCIQSSLQFRPLVSRLFDAFSLNSSSFRPKRPLDRPKGPLERRKWAERFWRNRSD